MPVSVRPAKQEDADAVAQVLCRSRSEFLPYAPMVHSPAEVRAWIAEALIPAGGVYVVDRVFGFDEAREALRYLEAGSHFGKVCIRV